MASASTPTPPSLKPPRDSNWSYEETEALIPLWRLEFEASGKRQLTSSQWKEIARKYSQLGFRRSGRQCGEKMRNLKKRYFKERERLRSLPAQSSSFWCFYPQLHEILKDVPTPSSYYYSQTLQSGVSPTASSAAMGGSDDHFRDSDYLCTTLVRGGTEAPEDEEEGDYDGVTLFTQGSDGFPGYSANTHEAATAVAAFSQAAPVGLPHEQHLHTPSAPHTPPPPSLPPCGVSALLHPHMHSQSIGVSHVSVPMPGGSSNSSHGAYPPVAAVPLAPEGLILQGQSSEQKLALQQRKRLLASLEEVLNPYGTNDVVRKILRRSMGGFGAAAARLGDLTPGDLLLRTGKQRAVRGTVAHAMQAEQQPGFHHGAHPSHQGAPDAAAGRVGVVMGTVEPLPPSSGVAGAVGERGGPPAPPAPYLGQTPCGCQGGGGGEVTGAARGDGPISHIGAAEGREGTAAGSEEGAPPQDGGASDDEGRWGAQGAYEYEEEGEEYDEEEEEEEVEQREVGLPDWMEIMLRGAEERQKQVLAEMREEMEVRVEEARRVWEQKQQEVQQLSQERDLVAAVLAAEAAAAAGGTGVGSGLAEEELGQFEAEAAVAGMAVAAAAGAEAVAAMVLAS